MVSRLSRELSMVQPSTNQPDALDTTELV
jgi:hypothetical protein